ncbi:toll-like receptor 7 [Amyelois transitella]|uniref:toll-like receptor 7 n=1 Tax=Amyelois transitella TaxID=680683 RepID=UPI00298F7285|nr:toll-like receptor 7 [Amyelois transitella]
MATLIIIIATLLSYTHSEYIPPGPRYPCPKETQLLHPCVCEKGTDAGLYIRCENSGLAVLSVGIGNLAGLGQPIERLLLKECKISNLFGPLLHRSIIRVLHIEDTPIKAIDKYAFAGVNRTLQEVRMVNTKIEEFPKEAFKILGNLSILSIDGHSMSKLDKDMFAGSEFAGRLERLHLSNGLIAEFAPETFQNLKKLKTLDLHGNRLSTFKRNQFKGLRDAEVLDLSYNNITKLDGSHIGDMTKLGWCNVSHNEIADMPRGMFARNTVLKVLHLDNNKLKKLDTNSFKGMRFMRRIFLQDNQISDIGRGTFSAVTRIGTIDLARNKINKIDYQMFKEVKYAELINLAENNITTIATQAFTDLYLSVVNISHNQLVTVERGAFQNCNNMTVLDLRYNKLEEIPRGAFDENSYAFELNIAYNYIRDFSQIPIQNMTGIRILNASYNQIESIPKMAFPKLYELHTVDVSHNKLSDVFSGVFQNLFSLRYLNLSHNDLEQIKPATFGSLPTVFRLDLSHNKLRSGSRGGLAKLGGCRELDLSNNYMDAIPQIPISLGDLNFAHNNLTEIKANTWPTMNSLLRLNLSHNMLETLEGHSFSGLLTVQHLDLSYNGITSPPWQALNTLSSLQYLYLQNNNITSLSKSAFGNLPTMFHLDLSYNNIAAVAQQSFNGMQQLLDLSLRGNRLDTIPNEAFKGLVALRKLDLSLNMLQKMDNKTNGLLDDCLSLEKVNLSRNRFSFLTKKMFPSSPWIPYRLMEVDLSHNEIPVLTADIIQGTRTVKKLYLKGNIINDIRSNVLGNLTSLEVLDLSDNNLKDLVSRTSVGNFQLPDNLTELYLRNNELEKLPVDEMVKSKIRILDVRNNKLTSFDPRFVRRISGDGMVVYFEGNYLQCDCLTRPLKHYINQLSLTALEKSLYKNITCTEPTILEGESILSIDEERLLCASNTELGNQLELYGNTEDFVSKPDLAFRDVQYAQNGIYVHWYVLTVQDLADFIIYIRDAKNTLLYSNTVSYNLRSLTINIDDELKNKISNSELCIQGKTSMDGARKWYSSQCRKVDSNFESWPKKLTVDKRRLTKKVKYSWFSNSVLGLVSDSILITLCIFLGVCLKLSDIDF